MEKIMKGDVVVVPFPFSDLSKSKKRPALVITRLQGEDAILCQITSKTKNDNYAIQLIEQDFSKGTLNTESTIRINKIFTADKSIIIYKAGQLNKSKIREIEQGIIAMISG